MKLWKLTCVTVGNIDGAFEGTAKQDSDYPLPCVLGDPIVVIDDAEKYQRMYYHLLDGSRRNLLCLYHVHVYSSSDISLVTLKPSFLPSFGSLICLFKLNPAGSPPRLANGNLMHKHKEKEPNTESKGIIIIIIFFNQLSFLLLRCNRPICSCKHSILILPCQICAFKSQSPSKNPLDVICNFNGRFASLAGKGMLRYTLKIESMIPIGSHRKVKRATSGVGLCTKRPSWKMIGLKSLFLGSGSHLVLVMVSLAVSKSHIGQVITPKLLYYHLLLVLTNKHTGLSDEPGGPARVRNVELGPEHPVGAEECLGEGLDHDAGAGGDNVALAEGVEDAPRVGVDVLGVEAWEDGAGDEVDVAEFEAGEGEEDEGLDGESFGDEEVGEVDEGDGGEEEEGAEEAAGFEGDEEVVREGAAGDEEGAVEVRGHRLVGARVGGAFGDGVETTSESSCSPHDHEL
ncbi:Glycerol-3-phosphate 2-O-acyltransferase 6 [Senna tora]|uniref:Glycerol-3-phosphate 2-O-acyltransferase 6 n=1 Tax=Senna tora TaxID=362788 RepID=A0A834XHB0_9FABA|nr:Glycerol-3-phosphate 2-O-acyltransferase 6 [Senna tora]